MAFIDANRADFAVESICATLSSAGLQVAASTDYAAKERQPSARQRRDAVLTPIRVDLWEANYQVHGARKLWKAAQSRGS